jgi:hypothetical protein
VLRANVNLHRRTREWAVHNERKAMCDVTYKCTREIPFPGPAGTHFDVGCAWVQRGQEMVLLDTCLIDRLTHECDHPPC